MRTSALLRTLFVALGSGAALLACGGAHGAAGGASVAAKADTSGSGAGAGTGTTPAGSVRDRMPRYYDFLVRLKGEGYAFWDFRTFADADKGRLPDRLVVLRHDIHANDVDAAYDMHEVETALLGDRVATYFVMLDMPPESRAGSYPATRAKYLSLIRYLKGHGVDVQPHVSPVDMYQYAAHPAWEGLGVEDLKLLWTLNYKPERDARGYDITVVGKDVFDLADFKSRGLDLLRRYNAAWKAETGLDVRYYAAHGSSTPMAQVMDNMMVLDQHRWLDSGVYRFDTYNTWILGHLKYLSDNDKPAWMDRPGDVKPGRYQLLAHPKLWR